MKFRKRQLILASLIAALGTAVYLNWQFTGDKNFQVSNMLQSTEELGEARYVNNSDFSDKDSSSSLQQSVSDKTKKYFAEAQISRQKAHEYSEEKLKNLLSMPNVNSETKEKINKSIDSISKTATEESNIENLIKSKGFSECLVFIENEECNVVVNPGSVSENSAIIIRDIVSGQSDIAASKVKIIEAK